MLTTTRNEGGHPEHPPGNGGASRARMPPPRRRGGSPGRQWVETRRQGRARAQREAGGGGDGQAAFQRELVALGHGRDDELHLGGGERAADAVARAAPEGKVREARAADGSDGREAIGIEGVGRLPEGGMAVG